jgi:hypothetical protein
MKELRRLFSVVSIPGWWVLAEIILGHASNGQLALAWLNATSQFLDKHLGWGLLFGFAWLTAVISFPKWKPTWLKMPRPKHEQVAEKVNEIERLMPRIDGAHLRLDEHGAWVSELERLFHATVEEIPRFGDFISQIDILVAQVDEALMMIDHLNSPQMTSTHLCDWRTHLSMHIQTCKSFALAFDFRESSVVEKALDLLCSSADSSLEPTEQARFILENQRNKLKRLKGEYSAKVMERIKERSQTWTPSSS